MSTRDVTALREGGQPLRQSLRHLYLFVASEGFLKGSKITMVCIPIDSRGHEISFNHLRYTLPLFPINGIPFYYAHE